MKSEKIKSISAFFPAWNEWGTLGSLISIVNQIFEENGIKDSEIIIIDNGSDDNTERLMGEMKKKYKNLRVVNLYPNQGYGGALQEGFKAAKKEFIFYTDADIQYDVNRLDKAIKLIDEHTDVVIGYKANRDDPIHRIIIGRLHKALVRKLFKLKTKDPDCDFRLIRGSLMKNIKLEQRDGLICVELMRRIEDNTEKIKQIPVRHFPRAFGKSKFFDFLQIYKTYKNLFRLRKKLMRK